MTDFDYSGLGGGALLRLSVTTLSQSIENNTSTLSWSLTLYEGAFASFSFTPIAYAVSINGVYYSGGFTFDFTSGGSQSVLIASGSTVVTHAADGTPGPGKFDVWGYIGDTGTSTGGPAYTIPGGRTYVPATIPRASTPTFELVSAPSVLVTEADAGVAIKINMNRASSGFTHTVDYSIGATGWQSIATGVGADHASWTIPLSLLSQIPAATSGALSIRVKTYNGATLIGEKTVVLTMRAGSGIVPDLGTITHAEATAVPDVATLIGAYVQGVTKLDVGITSPAGIYGSTIVAQKIEVVGQSGNQITNAVATALTGTLPAVLAASGSVTLRATVTDSRGRTYSEDVGITVLAYTLPNPAITPVSVQRALSGGTPDEDGTYIRTNLNASVQSLVVSAVEKNALTYRISTSPKDAATWTVKATVTPGGLTFNSHAEVGTYSIADSFDVRVEVLDVLAVVMLVLTIATSEVPFHLGETGAGFGKFNEGNAAVEVATSDPDGLGGIEVGGIDVRRYATDSVDGVVRLADDAATAAGTADDLAVTPEGLASLGLDEGYRLRQLVVFTSSGTFSKATYPWLRAIRVRVQAGGGGGGGSAATSSGSTSFGQGGGGGGYAESFIDDIAGLASSVTVTVGAGGTSGSGAAGGTGGASSFGSAVVTSGGGGGSVKPNSAYTAYIPGGVGGSASAGDLRFGGSGGGSGSGDIYGLCASGAGGSSHLGGGGETQGTGAGNGGVVGTAGKNYGGGGGGASSNAGSSARAGGAGAPGVVIVELFA